MRLLNAKTRELVDFTLRQVPPYAILSHTWGENEVTYHDMRSSNGTKKKSYAKIEETCRLAQEQELYWAWIDTCCIDKSSSAELSEAINSMFRWYQEATVCFVILEDLSNESTFDEGVQNSKWCTRGWTLQELLAPRHVQFYDTKWIYRGTKTEHKAALEKCTGIPQMTLDGSMDLQQYSAATKMAWASTRRTTLPEDIAYCLLGIFDINMPLLYGEGSRAYLRLQEEIIKQKNDPTIFSWGMQLKHDEPVIDLLAKEPAVFNCQMVGEFHNVHVTFAMTNSGVQIHKPGDGRGMVAISMKDSEGPSYALFIGFERLLEDALLLPLRKVAPRIFARDGQYELDILSSKAKERQIHFVNVSNFRILTNIPLKIDQAMVNARKFMPHVPFNSKFELKDAVPEEAWDWRDHIFLKSGSNTDFGKRDTLVYCLRFGIIVEGKPLSLCVLLEVYSVKMPICKIFILEHQTKSNLRTRLFGTRTRERGIFWDELRDRAPQIEDMYDHVEFSVEGEIVKISASFEMKTIVSSGRNIPVYDLNLDWTSRPLSQALSTTSGHQSLHFIEETYVISESWT